MDAIGLFYPVHNLILGKPLKIRKYPSCTRFLFNRKSSQRNKINSAWNIIKSWNGEGREMLLDSESCLCDTLYLKMRFFLHKNLFWYRIFLCWNPQVVVTFRIGIRIYGPWRSRVINFQISKLFFSSFETICGLEIFRLWDGRCE